MDSSVNNGVKKRLLRLLAGFLVSNEPTSVGGREQIRPELAPEEVFKVLEIIIYVGIALLLFTVYVCQKTQTGLFYWPAE